LDALERFPEKFRRLGIDPEQQCRTVTRDLWLNAQQALRAGQSGPAREAWRIFRRYHGLNDLARYAVRFLSDRLTNKPGTR
jgi:hypothetical protein